MSEYDDARAWREKQGLSQAKLGELTGYSRESIWWFEAGKCPPGRRDKQRAKIADWVWQRYKMACAGVDAQLKNARKFNW